MYSFGVVLLEIVTGRRPTDEEDFGDGNLVGWVKVRVGEGRKREVFDVELFGGDENIDCGEVERLLEIALLCVDEFASKRPAMLEVVANDGDCIRRVLTVLCAVAES